MFEIEMKHVFVRDIHTKKQKVVCLMSVMGLFFVWT